MDADITTTTSITDSSKDAASIEMLTHLKSINDGLVRKLQLSKVETEELKIQKDAQAHQYGKRVRKLESLIVSLETDLKRSNTEMNEMQDRHQRELDDGAEFRRIDLGASSRPSSEDRLPVSVLTENAGLRKNLDLHATTLLRVLRAVQSGQTAMWPKIIQDVFGDRVPQDLVKLIITAEREKEWAERENPLQTSEKQDPQIVAGDDYEITQILRSSLSNSKRKFGTLREEHSRVVKHWEDAFNSLYKTHHELQAQHKSTLDSNEGFEIMLNSLNKQHSKLKAKYDELKESGINTKHDLKQQSAHMETLETQKTKLKSQLQRYEFQFQDQFHCFTKSQDAVVGLEKMNRGLNDQIRNLESQVEDYKTVVNVTEDEFYKYRESQDMIHGLNQKGLERLVDVVQLISGEDSSVFGMDVIRAQKHQALDMTIYVTALEGILSSFKEQRNSDLEKLTGKLAESKQIRVELSARLQDLLEECQDNARNRELLDQMTLKFGTYKNQLAGVLEEIERKESVILSLVDEKTELSVQMAEVKKELQKSSGNNKTLRVELKRKSTSTKEVLKKMEETESERTNLEIRIKNLQVAVTHKDNYIRDLKSKQADIVTKLEINQAQSTELQTLCESHKKFKSESSRKEDTIKHLKSQIEANEQQTTNFRKTNTELLESRSATMQQNEATKRILRDRNLIIASSQDEMKRFQNLETRYRELLKRIIRMVIQFVTERKKMDVVRARKEVELRTINDLNGLNEEEKRVHERMREISREFLGTNYDTFSSAYSALASAGSESHGVMQAQLSNVLESLGGSETFDHEVLSFLQQVLAF